MAEAVEYRGIPMLYRIIRTATEIQQPERAAQRSLPAGIRLGHGEEIYSNNKLII